MSSAETFAGLHKTGEPLLLPNAWDVASAVTIAGAGAKAIATTSAGVAWSLGVADGVDFGADRSAAVVERIVRAVDVPVTADIEAGYGSVADTVTAVLQAGAVGVNIEDCENGRLLAPAEQAERLAAARAAADSLGIPAWINARTDIYLTSVTAAEDRLAAALERAAVYAEAGANSLFVPGLIDLPALAELTAGPLPIAVMAWAGAPTVAEFANVGVVRISLGAAIAQAAYAVAARATAELLTHGTYDSTAEGIPYDATNKALSK
ncbi:2-methylisocitrate lyase-like PEP mutase family enzyme [Kibdelosporangium banguiense]|uniref:2-methylisocitrate lyase-like PEP mutase family enzyme n=1 Tax=Kibdelosporangium banguiense TaxID=1365924 RepID=A0ABS4TTI7_9PSEU|nr:isocitrate lyase/phosphoenolpyruvate mutase family protein [Kibdelosporangium banguiense]MBP2327702.1 2-methylisocitrate lyase-like PEP mutase family enzyme [Kibdelosporangium banguiense]